MSAASHLATVLRAPFDPNPPSQSTPQAESQELPSDEAPASLANADALLGSHEPTKASPSEPITPTLGGPTGAAPLPTSWPTAQKPPAQHNSQPDVDARKQQGQQQQQLTGSLAPSSGETAGLPTIAQSDDMTVEQAEVSSSSSHVDAGDVVTDTQHTSQCNTEPLLGNSRQLKPESGHASAQPDSMQFRPPDEKDGSAAQSAAQSATQSAAAREASAATQEQGR